MTITLQNNVGHSETCLCWQQPTSFISM